MIRRNLLFVAAAVISILLFQTYVLEPKSETMRDEIRKKFTELQKYESYIEGSALTDSDTKKISEEMKNSEKKLITESSEFLASARMQREISDLAQKSGIGLQTIRPLNTSKLKSYFALPVYFEGSGTIRQFSEFIKNMESYEVMLKIDKMSVNVTNMQNTREIRFKMQVSGLGRI